MSATEETFMGRRNSGWLRGRSNALFTASHVVVGRVRVPREVGTELVNIVLGRRPG